MFTLLLCAKTFDIKICKFVNVIIANYLPYERFKHANCFYRQDDHETRQKGFIMVERLEKIIIPMDITLYANRVTWAIENKKIKSIIHLLNGSKWLNLNFLEIANNTDSKEVFEAVFTGLNNNFGPLKTEICYNWALNKKLFLAADYFHTGKNDIINFEEAAQYDKLEIMAYLASRGRFKVEHIITCMCPKFKHIAKIMVEKTNPKQLTSTLVNLLLSQRKPGFIAKHFSGCARKKIILMHLLTQNNKDIIVRIVHSGWKISQNKFDFCAQQQFNNNCMPLFFHKDIILKKSICLKVFRCFADRGYNKIFAEFLSMHAKLPLFEVAFAGRFMEGDWTDEEIELAKKIAKRIY